MTKLGGLVHCTKISTEFEFGVIAPGCTPQKCGVWLRRWEHQRKLSSLDQQSESAIFIPDT